MKHYDLHKKKSLIISYKINLIIYIIFGKKNGKQTNIIISTSSTFFSFFPEVNLGSRHLVIAGAQSPTSTMRRESGPCLLKPMVADGLTQ